MFVQKQSVHLFKLCIPLCKQKPWINVLSLVQQFNN